MYSRRFQKPVCSPSWYSWPWIPGVLMAWLSNFATSITTSVTILLSVDRVPLPLSSTCTPRRAAAAAARARDKTRGKNGIFCTERASYLMKIFRLSIDLGSTVPAYAVFVSKISRNMPDASRDQVSVSSWKSASFRIRISSGTSQIHRPCLPRAVTGSASLRTLRRIHMNRPVW